jgi:excinuclease ABC subunit B
MGRAARNVDGRVILYADRMTKSMKEAIGETERRRTIQAEFNATHGIVPRSAKRSEQRSLGEATSVAEALPTYGVDIPTDPNEQRKLVEHLRKEMFDAAAKREYERAAQIRDTIQTILKQLVAESPDDSPRE